MNARKKTPDPETVSKPQPDPEEMESVKRSAEEIDVVTEDAPDELAQLQDQYVRLLAEFDNYKKRTAREWQARVQGATADLLLELLDMADNFERALAAEHNDDAYARGVQMIYEQLNGMLRRQGVSEIPALGEVFDPSIHEALLHVASTDHDEGIVCQMIRRGYRLHDRVLRPAQVAVSRGPDADASEANAEA